jgi:hypothetical protein
MIRPAAKQKMPRSNVFVDAIEHEMKQRGEAKPAQAT